MRIISALWLLTGMTFTSLGIPLILKWIPPNKFYGFRVAKTFSSEEIWYEANQIAGFDLLVAGLVICLTALITNLLVERFSSLPVNGINFSVFAVTLAIAVIHSFLYLK